MWTLSLHQASKPGGNGEAPRQVSCTRRTPAGPSGQGSLHTAKWLRPPVPGAGDTRPSRVRLSQTLGQRWGGLQMAQDEACEVSLDVECHVTAVRSRAPSAAFEQRRPGVSTEDWTKRQRKCSEVRRLVRASKCAYEVKTSPKCRKGSSDNAVPMVPWSTSPDLTRVFAEINLIRS